MPWIINIGCGMLLSVAAEGALAKTGEQTAWIVVVTPAHCFFQTHQPFPVQLALCIQSVDDPVKEMQ
jgi:hypothetical protein